MKQPEFGKILVVFGLGRNSIARVESEEFDLLLVRNDDEFLTTLDPLVPFREKIKALKVSAFANGLASLDLLDRLEFLDLGDLSPDRKSDIARLSQLRWLRTKWHKSLNSAPIGSLRVLRSLSILNVNADNAEWMASMPELSELELRLGSIRSFAGIAGAPLLSRVDLRSVRGFNSVIELSQLRLRHLEIETRFEIDDFTELMNSQSDLEWVSLSGSTSIKSTQWMEANRNLRYVSVGVDPSCIDLEGAMRSASLRTVMFVLPSVDSLPDERITRAAARAAARLVRIERGGTRRQPWCILHFAG